MLECPSFGRDLPAASALNCLVSSISDNQAGPGLAACRSCRDTYAAIAAERWLALAWLFSSSPDPVHCHRRGDGHK